MENASKALLIAGSVLIAMLVLSVGVYLYISMSRVKEQYNRDELVAELTKFNTEFTVFQGRNDIRAHEIVTLNNFAKKYESKSGKHIKILVGNNEISDDLSFLKENTTTDDDKIATFNCIKKVAGPEVIEYDNEDGRVKKIIFYKN